jgi:hypothetical protein
MQRTKALLSVCFCAGLIGAFFNSLFLWALGRIGVTRLLEVNLTPYGRRNGFIHGWCGVVCGVWPIFSPSPDPNPATSGFARVCGSVFCRRLFNSFMFFPTRRRTEPWGSDSVPLLRCWSCSLTGFGAFLPAPLLESFGGGGNHLSTTLFLLFCRFFGDRSKHAPSGARGACVFTG